MIDKKLAAVDKQCSNEENKKITVQLFSLL